MSLVSFETTLMRQGNPINATCSVIGWVVSETVDDIVVVSCMSQTAGKEGTVDVSLGDNITIPKKNVLSLWTLALDEREAGLVLN
jgi:hypothetical protein